MSLCPLCLCGGKIPPTNFGGIPLGNRQAGVLAYLRNQAWYHLQRLIVGAAGGVGLLVLLVLGFRHKQRAGRKPKIKRETA